MGAAAVSKMCCVTVDKHFLEVLEAKLQNISGREDNKNCTDRIICPNVNKP